MIFIHNIYDRKKDKEVSELKGKILIKFDDNTNDLVDIVVGADGIFLTPDLFLKRKKISQNLKAIAVNNT